MIELLRLHWQFIRRPSSVIEELIPSWPVSYGLVVFTLNLVASYLGNAQASRIASDIIAGYFGLSGTPYLYLLLAIVIGYGILILYYLQPHVVRWVARIPEDVFQPDLYRKLVFYSSTASVIFTVIAVLPIQVLTGLMMLDGSTNISTIVVIAIQGLVGLWLIVPAINTFVIQWKGLAKYFNMTPGQIILVEVVIPLILASPFIVMFGSGYLEFILKYMQ